MNKIIIAIDGHSGCGKSTTAKLVAKKLNYKYIDTGAMYRAITLFFHQQQIDSQDAEAVLEALSNIKIHFEWNPEAEKSDAFLNGKNVEQEIRKMYISQNVSEVSKIAAVRKAMVAQQQVMGQDKEIVMDGRDIGTNVFPQAELKIFMTSQVEVRAARRQMELEEKGEMIDLQTIIQNLKQRDWIDSTRKENPLQQAEDAILLDTSYISIEEQVDFVVNLAKKAIYHR
jgi:CMP/dCMP kinase